MGDLGHQTVIDQAKKVKIQFPAVLSFGQDAWGYDMFCGSDLKKIIVPQEEIVIAYGGCYFDGCWTFSVIYEGQKVCNINVDAEDWIKVF